MQRVPHLPGNAERTEVPLEVFDKVRRECAPFRDVILSITVRYRLLQRFEDIREVSPVLWWGGFTLRFPPYTRNSSKRLGVQSPLVGLVMFKITSKTVNE